MEINIKVNIKMENSMVKENIPGLMDHVIRASLWRESGKAKAAGSQLKAMETYTSVPTKLTRKMDMEDMYGQMDACTREGSPTMLSTFIVIQAWKGQIDLSRRQGSKRSVV